jgi:transcriptional regulator with XRE-family HTH domain
MRKLRIGQGYSQQEIARAVRVNPRTVVRWEMDESEPTLGEPLRNLAAFLRVTPGFLLNGEEE